LAHCRPPVGFARRQLDLAVDQVDHPHRGARLCWRRSGVPTTSLRGTTLSVSPSRRALLPDLGTVDIRSASPNRKKLVAYHRRREAPHAARVVPQPGGSRAKAYFLRSIIYVMYSSPQISMFCRNESARCHVELLRRCGWWRRASA
jgi:hypothetical protein